MLYIPCYVPANIIALTQQWIQAGHNLFSMYTSLLFLGDYFYSFTISERYHSICKTSEIKTIVSILYAIH